MWFKIAKIFIWTSPRRKKALSVHCTVSKTSAIVNSESWRGRRQQGQSELSRSLLWMSLEVFIQTRFFAVEHQNNQRHDEGCSQG
ncbi:Uncharacterised protein [Vibrio cholerae]|nr:Uncharacterised protein [Vibrio cholerae]